MKELSRLVLCNYKNEQVEVHVTASIERGALILSGQDLGNLVERIWGDEDYEYWYALSPENTTKLFRLLNAEDDPELALLEYFSGESGCARLRDFCETNGIEYKFACFI